MIRRGIGVVRSQRPRSSSTRSSSIRTRRAIVEVGEIQSAGGIDRSRSEHPAWHHAVWPIKDDRHRGILAARPCWPCQCPRARHGACWELQQETGQWSNPVHEGARRPKAVDDGLVATLGKDAEWCRHPGPRWSASCRRVSTPRTVWNKCFPRRRARVALACSIKSYPRPQVPVPKVAVRRRGCTCGSSSSDKPNAVVLDFFAGSGTTAPRRDAAEQARRR